MFPCMSYFTGANTVPRRSVNKHRIALESKTFWASFFTEIRITYPQQLLNHSMPLKILLYLFVH